MSDGHESVRADGVIRALLAGKLATSQVPPDLVPRVRVSLDSLKQKAIADGDVDRVRRVHKLQQEFRSTNLRRQSGLRSARALPTVRRQSQRGDHPTRQEVCDALGAIVDGRSGLSADDARLVPYLIQRAKERIAQLVRDEAYTRAQDYENALRTLLVIGGEKQVETKRRTKRQRLAEALENARAALADAEANFDAFMAEVASDQDQGREPLLRDQADELDDFDAKTSDGMPQSFVKFSPALLELREQQRMLIATKRFGEAAEVRDIVEDAERREMDALKAKWGELRAVQRKQRADAHAANLHCYDEKAERNALKWEQTLRLDIEGKRRAVDNLALRLQALDAVLRVEPQNATSFIAVQWIRPKIRSSAALLHGGQKVTVATQTTQRLPFPARRE
jgi:hypothetical protein